MLFPYAKIQAYGSLKAKMILNHQIQVVKKIKKIKIKRTTAK